MHVRPAMYGVPLRGKLEKILQQQMPVLGRDAFGMELHAVHGQRLVREAHDQPVAVSAVTLSASGMVSRSTTSEW